MESQIIEIPRFFDKRGSLSFIENDTLLPFNIERVFWIYDVPGGEDRGGHAYRETEEFIVALSGSFDVVLDDGKNNVQVFHLNRSYYGLYVPKMIWRQMKEFSTNSVAMVLASTSYHTEDYLRNYEEFKIIAR